MKCGQETGWDMWVSLSSLWKQGEIGEPNRGGCMWGWWKGASCQPFWGPWQSITARFPGWLLVGAEHLHCTYNYAPFQGSHIWPVSAHVSLHMPPTHLERPKLSA